MSNLKSWINTPRPQQGSPETDLGLPHLSPKQLAIAAAAGLVSAKLLFGDKPGGRAVGVLLPLAAAAYIAVDGQQPETFHPMVHIASVDLSHQAPSPPPRPRPLP